MIVHFFVVPYYILAISTFELITHVRNCACAQPLPQKAPKSKDIIKIETTMRFLCLQEEKYDKRGKMYHGLEQKRGPTFSTF